MPFTSTDLRRDYPETDLWMPDDTVEALAFDNVPEGLRTKLEAQGSLHLIRSAKEIDQYLQHPDLRLIAGRSGLKLTSDQIQRAPGLAMIAKCCIGTDGLDFAMAGERGVLIVNSRQAANSVAEMAVESALGLARNTIGSIIEASIVPPEGKLRKVAEGRRELKYMKVGIVGAGQIGQLTAEKMRPLAEEILMYDDAPNAAEKIGRRGTVVNNLDELLERCDIVIIHADADDHDGNSNEDLITAERLKDKNVFGVINLARGHIAKTTELVEAIEKAYIQRARTDVFLPREEERCQWVCPIPRDMIMDGRFVGTAHIGASTEEVQRAIGEDITRKWENFRHYRDIGPGQNFSSDRFGSTDLPYSIVFQHSIARGTLGNLAGVLGEAGIDVAGSTTEDMKGTPTKNTSQPLAWGMTRFDTVNLVDEVLMGNILENLKQRNGGLKLHRVAVLRRT